MATAEKWHKFKPLPTNILERIARLPEYLSQTHVQLAYLFGSLAKEAQGEDVDLALLMAEGGKRPYQLHDDLSAQLNIERLDIVDLRRASPLLRFEIISSGNCIYAVNEAIQLDFELATVREYKDTAYLRQKQVHLLQERMTKWSLNTTALPSD